MSPRELRAVAFAVCIFLAVQIGALALVPTFYDSGYQTVENPQDPTNSALYIGAILVATGLMLAAFKYDLDRAVRWVIVFTSGLLSWYVFAVLLPPALAVVPAALVAVGLLVHPEWYVIDAAGVLMGAGAAGLFGISFGLLPAIVLLAALAVYDAVSVYGTKHMLSLAEGVMELRIPVVLVVPTTLSYSLLADDFSDANDLHEGDAESDPVPDAENEAAVKGASAPDGRRPEAPDAEDEAANEGESGERDAYFIGLGDAVMPAVMVASAGFFSPAPSLGGGALAVNLPALFAMAGTTLGLLALMWAVTKGRAHAGLPLLNGGAIGGYLLGSVLAGVSLVEAVGLAGWL